MRFVVVVVLMGFVGCDSCTKANPNACCTDQADCSSHGIPQGQTCEQGLVCRGNQCIAEVCNGNADCDAAAPYCRGGTCVEQCAVDADCPGFGQGSSAVYCAGGSCVQCRTNADCPTGSPTCDMGVCHGCSSHADCASKLCDVDSSTCVDEANAIYAAPTGTGSGDCSMVAPCTFERAFAVVTATRNQIKLENGTYSNSGVTVMGPNTVSLYGPATVNGGNGASSIDGGSLRIRDVTVNGSLGCTNDTVNLPMNTLDLARVVVTSDTPFYLDVCNTTLANVTVNVTGATGVGIQLQGETTAGGGTTNRNSLLTMRDCLVTGGAPAIVATSLGVFDVQDSIFVGQSTTTGVFDVTSAKSTSSISFSTIYNTVLKCPTVQGNGSLSSSSNIILNRRVGAPADTATGVDCTHAYDLITPQSTALTGTGNILGADPKFVNASSNDFHLMMGSPAIDAADPAATITTDYDGTMRPQGARRDIGAFEYKP
ncbi:MAG: hypothetical protein JO257_30165 [Deltaproteobacteria bacterium]|nr:hypothetical protein [Deltaproteobacteria bacterium]